MDQAERLEAAVMLLIEHYSLPIGEVRALLYEEDYPPLEEGDLGSREWVLMDGGRW